MTPKRRALKAEASRGCRRVWSRRRPGRWPHRSSQLFRRFAGWIATKAPQAPWKAGKRPAPKSKNRAHVGLEDRASGFVDYLGCGGDVLVGNAVDDLDRRGPVDQQRVEHPQVCSAGIERCRGTCGRAVKAAPLRCGRLVVQIPMSVPPVRELPDRITPGFRSARSAEPEQGCSSNSRAPGCPSPVVEALGVHHRFLGRDSGGSVGWRHLGLQPRLGWPQATGTARPVVRDPAHARARRAGRCRRRARRRRRRRRRCGPVDVLGLTTALTDVLAAGAARQGPRRRRPDGRSSRSPVPCRTTNEHHTQVVVDRPSSVPVARPPAGSRNLDSACNR